MERMYLRILSELAMNRFKWSGMPDTVDVRYLEMQLFYSARCIFYFDNRVDQYLALAGTPAGVINMYQNPTKFNVYGPNFASRTLTKDEAVPIWANYLRMPDQDVVRIYAGKLSQIDMTIEINMASARRTRVAVIDENTQLSADNINRQINEGVGLIKVTSAGLGTVATAIDLGIDPKSLEALSILRSRLWSEVMGLLGIDNANQDKKERLVSGEVEANAEQVSSMKHVNLNARRKAAYDIGRMFSELNVSVDYNTDQFVNVPNSLALTQMDTIEMENESSMEAV